MRGSLLLSFHYSLLIETLYGIKFDKKNHGFVAKNCDVLIETSPLERGCAGCKRCLKEERKIPLRI